MYHKLDKYVPFRRHSTSSSIFAPCIETYLRVLATSSRGNVGRVLGGSQWDGPSFVFITSPRLAPPAPPPTVAPPGYLQPDRARNLVPAFQQLIDTQHVLRALCVEGQPNRRAIPGDPSDPHYLDRPARLLPDGRAER
jgi:hypothetical protein